MTRGRFSSLSVEEYVSSTGAALGRRVLAGELSPVQLTEIALHLARAAEPAVNAYAALFDDRALSEARRREKDVRDGLAHGALHGVPIAIKDNFLYEGEPTGKGSRTTSRAPATTSAPMVQRLLDAGTVVIGATTTPEFGWKGTGISPRTGVTRNPWDPARGSGGSSAGAGATVGSGAVPIATGTDAGGSVRIPAAFCGVVGLKPTLSAIPLWPGTVNESLSHAGVLTRSVADAATVFRLTRGPDARDPQSYQSGQPTGSAREAPRRLRVGVVREPFGIAPEPGVGRVVDQAIETIRASGIADLRETAMTAPLPRAVFEALWVTGRGLGFAHLLAEHEHRMDPGLVRVAGIARGYTLADYYDALRERRAFNASMAQLLDHWDLLLMPTMPLTAFAADAEVPEGGEADAPLPWITWTPYTYPFNVSGQPALTLPCGLASDGLPVGLQIVGPWAHDERVLGFAADCEAALAGSGVPTVAPRLG